MLRAMLPRPALGGSERRGRAQESHGSGGLESGREDSLTVDEDEELYSALDRGLQTSSTRSREQGTDPLLQHSGHVRDSSRSTSPMPVPEHRPPSPTWDASLPGRPHEGRGDIPESPWYRSPVLMTAFGCLFASAVLVSYSEVERMSFTRETPMDKNSRTLEVPPAPITQNHGDASTASPAGLAMPEGQGRRPESLQAPLAEGGGEAVSAIVRPKTAARSKTATPSTRAAVPSAKATTTSAAAELAPRKATHTLAASTTKAHATTRSHTTTKATATTTKVVTRTTSTRTAHPPACGAADENCKKSHCCAAAGAQCYEKNASAAFCKLECRAGPDMAEEEYSGWTCKKLGHRTKGNSTPINWTRMPVPKWVEKGCSATGANCYESRCCREPGMQCYAKDDKLARCKPSCLPGPDFEDYDSTHWSCKEIGPRTPGKVPVLNTTGLPIPDWAEFSCADSGEDCRKQRCCTEPGHQCFEKDKGWSSCKPDCIPGPQPEDRADHTWNCKPLGPMTPGDAEVKEIRRGSFIVIGNWGWDEGTSSISQKCQNTIAYAMDQKMSELGDVKFVINLGDSFFPEGVENKDDHQWDKKWRWVYSVQLRSVPWFSVYGDLDYRKDPCACTEHEDECAQVNYDKDNFELFQMPGTSYFHEFPELGVELVGLDLNNLQNGGDFTDENSADEFQYQDCFKTSCAFACLDIMKSRTEKGLHLLYKRLNKSNQSSLVVFSHYPTDHFRAVPKLLEKLRDNSTHAITYFGAHRQTTEELGVSIEPNSNWVVGGGGGNTCESDKQGFVVGKIWGDSSITIDPVYVESESCCA